MPTTSKQKAGLTERPAGYADWLKTLKSRIHVAQQRAALQVNTELIQLYFEIGRDILDRQDVEGWGAGVVAQIALDLQKAFPGMKGFSRTNLLYMRAFAEAWPDFSNVQQLVGHLPWGHNLVLLTKLKDRNLRLQYAERVKMHSWSRNVLTIHIEQRTVEREGKAITNFETRLPAEQSDLAKESLKDPYLFDFLTIDADASEKEIENALVAHMTKFLLELGAGFAYVGKQVHLEVGDRDFYIDLLFYHLKLHAYVVIELKTGEFKPEHTGQLSFYLTAVDKQLKTENDTQTIGLLLCKSKNRIIAEYALSDSTKPIGVAEYQLTQSLPEEFESALPSIEQIEKELGNIDDEQ
ncbi:MAG: DUF1016 family protein [Deltaproteobacteria bacterium]|nr:DUF1016 family protein [Deltaproteobacteria bacterium]